jgi:hypothetical protein
MLRLHTDFQAVGPGGYCWILKYNSEAFEGQATKLRVSVGDKVVLDAHEDFEVIGMLDRKFVEYLGREAWVAYPDWSTRKDK